MGRVGNYLKKSSQAIKNEISQQWLWDDRDKKTSIRIKEYVRAIGRVEAMMDKDKWMSPLLFF